MKRLLRSVLPRSAIRAYHFLCAWVGAVWYRFPSRRLLVVGITGTSGKSSTIFFVRQILEALGQRACALSTIEFALPSGRTLNDKKMTMLGRFFIQRFLRRAVRERCDVALIETTSEGVVQHRHRGIAYDVAVLTNLYPEHIEAHGGFEPYVRAKLDLFWRLPRSGIAVINRDDALANRVSAACRSAVAWYGRDGIEYKKHAWPIRNYNSGDFGIMFDVKGHQIRSSLQGDVNADNIRAAVAAALALRVPLDAISRGIAGVKEIPGRMQIIQQKPFRVIVDYAHTPDSLERIYASVADKKNKIQGSRLICVLGSAGGGRDIWKRPEFGKIAARNCREIIVTNEDPFDESPENIMEEIVAGARSEGRTAHIERTGDRREAIRRALSFARNNDAVIITGKGNETFIRAARGEKIPWNDEQVVREELARHADGPQITRG